jgi:hypothetical protein
MKIYSLLFSIVLLARLPAYLPASFATVKPSSLPSSNQNTRDLCMIVLPCFETYNLSFYSPGASKFFPKIFKNFFWGAPLV